MLLGSLEAGATKFTCAIGNDDYQIKNLISFPTESPEKTLDKAILYFKKFDIKGLGIASFGPIDIQRTSPTYGYITSTTRLDWRNIPFLATLQAALAIPISWTTNVNGSAYGEYVMSHFANEKISSLVYVTIDTGVGAGIVYNGKLLGSISHPEMGHIQVKRHPLDTEFPGVCPYHFDCLEGLVSMPAVNARSAKYFTDSTAISVWDIEAYYIAQALIQVTLLIHPGKIVLGGRLMNSSLLDKIRTQFIHLLNHYDAVPNLDTYITPPFIQNNDSAIIGNFTLALNKLTNADN
ncbi:MAG: ROK family protein [Enterococcus sp.]